MADDQEPFYLGESLRRLEERDDTVRKARERLDDTIDKIVHPDDHVRPENLQVDPDE